MIKLEVLHIKFLLFLDCKTTYLTLVTEMAVIESFKVRIPPKQFLACNTTGLSTTPGSIVRAIGWYWRSLRSTDSNSIPLVREAPLLTIASQQNLNKIIPHLLLFKEAIDSNWIVWFDLKRTAWKWAVQWWISMLIFWLCMCGQRADKHPSPVWQLLLRRRRRNKPYAWVGMQQAVVALCRNGDHHLLQNILFPFSSWCPYFGF